MLQPSLLAGAAARLSRARPLTRQVWFWGACVYGGNTRSSLDSRDGCGLPTCVHFTPNTQTCLLLVLVTVLLQAQHRSDYLDVSLRDPVGFFKHVELL